MTKPVATLIWKEYRQQRLLVVALFVFSLLIQLSMCMMSILVPNNQFQTAYFSVAMFMTALYAAGAGAILFANEHEERTFTFLRSLPISGGTILTGKLSWLLASTLVLGLLTAFGSLIWLPFTEATDQPGVVFGVCGVGVIEALCWGLFWSPRCKSQLHSLLATFTCASVTTFLVSIVHREITGGAVEPWSLNVYANAAIWRLAVILPVGAAGLVACKNWIHAKMTVQIPVDAKKNWTYDSLKAMRPVRGEYRWLFWQVFRQSRGVILYGIIAGLLILGCIAYYYKPLSSGQTNVMAADAILVPFFAILGLFTLVFYNGSVFAADQKTRTATMLAWRGVSPVKIWWSRILVFGIPHLVFAGILTMIVLFYEIRFNYWGFFEEIFSVRFFKNFLNIFTLYAWCFCVGQLLSQFFRSPIIAMVGTGATLVPLYLWVMLTWENFEFSPFWTTLPVMIGCLVATRLHTHDWLRGRKLRVSWKRLVLPIVIPAAAILTLIPIVRVYEIPKIYLGYNYNPAWDYRPIGLGTRGNFSGKINSYVYGVSRGSESSQVAIPILMDYWMEVQWMYRNSDFVDTIMYTNMETGILNALENLATAEGSSTDDLKQVIAFFESIPQHRASRLDQLRWIYYEGYAQTVGGVDYDPTLYRNSTEKIALSLLRSFFFWEKYRSLRRLDYEFQKGSRLAESAENCVYNNVGSYESLLKQRRRFWDEENRTPIDLISISYPYRYSYGYWNPASIMQKEIYQRITLLKLALYGWKKEHGELPETLDVLKGTWLTEIPVVPYINEPFGYYPHPDGTEVAKLNAEPENGRYRFGQPEQDLTVPFLYVPLDVDRPWEWTEFNRQIDENGKTIRINKTWTRRPGKYYQLRFMIPETAKTESSG